MIMSFLRFHIKMFKIWFKVVLCDASYLVSTTATSIALVASIVPPSISAISISISLSASSVSATTIAITTTTIASVSSIIRPGAISISSTSSTTISTTASSTSITSTPSIILRPGFVNFYLLTKECGAIHLCSSLGSIFLLIKGNEGIPFPSIVSIGDSSKLFKPFLEIRIRCSLIDSVDEKLTALVSVWRHLKLWLFLSLSLKQIRTSQPVWALIERDKKL